MDGDFLYQRKWKRLELALLFGMAIALLTGLYLDTAQASLSSKVIRLHVIANSDSQEDQALKLKVRDAVLELADSYYAPEDDLETAERKLSVHLEELAAAGAEVVRDEGYDYLSAGDYDSAIASLEKALEIGEQDRRSMYYLAQAYAGKGDVENAVTWYQKVVDNYPGTQSALNAQAYIDEYSDQLDSGDSDEDQQDQTGGTDDTGTGAEEQTYYNG